MTSNPKTEAGASLLPCQSQKSLARTKHGHTSRQLTGGKESPTYRSWQAMRARCRLAGRDNADRYKNLGIVVCDRWSSFDNFLADMGERPDGMTLDRYPNSAGNYEPGNCRWATPQQQARNTRRSKLTLETATEVAVLRLRGVGCKEIAEQFGISESLPREIIRGRTWPDALDAAKHRLENTNV
jgi:hypothetical protein